VVKAIKEDQMNQAVHLRWTFCLAFAGLLAASGAGLHAQKAPTPPRTLLQADLQGIAGQEVIIQVVDIPPGGATPKHIHPDGHEIAFVLEGDTFVEIEGEARKSLKSGELVHIAPNIPHLGGNPSSSVALKLLVVRIKDKSKPIMVPVR
jgi:quercetin dioxygenase-like cupin family protein